MCYGATSTYERPQMWLCTLWRVRRLDWGFRKNFEILCILRYTDIEKEILKRYYQWLGCTLMKHITESSILEIDDVPKQHVEELFM